MMQFDTGALTAVFLCAVAAEALTRLWLGTRQIAALQAHRNQVPELFRGQIALTEQQKAADYSVARARLGRWATLIEAAIKIALTVGGGIAAVDALLRPVRLPEPWHGALVVMSVLILLQVVELPVELRRTFGVEARFGFNRISPRLFMIDVGKRLLLALLIGGPLLIATLALMQYAGVWWWVWVWVVWQGATLLLMWAAPRFIAPLFNKFSALADESLKRRVEILLERCGYAARGGVFVMDGSRRSSHGNAYFTGMGRNKRIVFFDTLLERVEAGEIEAVLAHELGHFRLRHITQRLLLSMLATFVGLALLAWLARQPEFYSALGVPVASPAAALLLFMVAVPVFLFFTTPLGSWWSRRHERQADDFAARHSDARQLASALVKLYRDNAAALTPDRIHSAFFDSHPPAPERIARLHALAAAKAG